MWAGIGGTFKIRELLGMDDLVEYPYWFCTPVRCLSPIARIVWGK